MTMQNDDSIKKFLDTLTTAKADSTERVPLSLTKAFINRISPLWLNGQPVQTATAIANMIIVDINKNTFEIEKDKNYTLLCIDRYNAELLCENAHYVLPHAVFCRYFVFQFTNADMKNLLEAVETLMAEQNALNKTMVERFLQKETFAVGDRVQWKEGLDNASFPYVGEIATVIEVIDPPITNRSSSEDTDAVRGGEILDIVIARVSQETKNLVHYLVDSRRFTKVIDD